MSNGTPEAKPAIDLDLGSFDEVEERLNKILAPGLFSVQVKDWDSKYGKESGNPYLAWQLSTVDCADPDDNNTVLFMNTPLSGKGLRILVNFMNALGVKWEGGKVENTFLDGLIGMELKVEVGIRTWVDPDSNESRDQNEVKKVLPRG